MPQMSVHQITIRDNEFTDHSTRSGGMASTGCRGRSATSFSIASWILTVDPAAPPARQRSLPCLCAARGINAHQGTAPFAQLDRDQRRLVILLKRHLVIRFHRGRYRSAGPPERTRASAPRRRSWAPTCRPPGAHRAACSRTAWATMCSDAPRNTRLEDPLVEIAYGHISAHDLLPSAKRCRFLCTARK